ncbi:MAG: VWA domain-containing protein [Leptospiraceae bacterium]|nr:VWA domain-containing protein [Leptospiraceae bacterium]
MTSSDKERREYRIILENLKQIETLLQEEEKLFSNSFIRSHFERCIEKIGEAIKRLNIKTSIFKIFKDIRNQIAHEFETNIQEIISVIKKNSDLLKEFAEEKIQSMFSENKKIREFEKFFKRGETKERRELVDALHERLTERTSEFQISFPQTSAFKHFSNSIEKIIAYPSLPALTRENETLATQVTEEILEWVESTHKQIERENPHFEEERFFEEVQSLSSEEFLSHYQEIFEELKKIYNKGEISFSFFEKKLKKSEKNFQKEELELIKENFLKEWLLNLQKKKDVFELEKIEQLRKEFIKNLYEKIENFRKLRNLLEPFTKDLGRLWDLSKGVWQTSGFEILQHYAEVLEKEKSIRELAELLGRYRKAEEEWEEEELEKVVVTTRYKPRHAPKGEVVGIRESNQIHDVLPMELATLKNPILRPIFFKKFAEKKLLSFSYRNQFPSREENKQYYKERVRKEKQKQGPIILCIDTSGSMHGTPERIAKTLCFALTKIAISENRRCYLISFSTQIQTIELTELKNSLPLLVNFLQMSFYGGTDATPALKEALRMLETQSYQRADVLMISDFVMNNLPTDLTDKIEKAKQNKTRFHSLVIGQSQNQTLISNFDTNLMYDPQNQTVKELIKMTKEILS